ncbi:MAG TPA: F0F1 ATP synthase subunit alpha, partial [Ignavibacteria bacterium]|nr:F0F1 ATP synthase subunit alpha [Ignavibacteria bacterium]
QYAPIPIEKQVVSIFLGSKGYLDGIPVADIQKFVKEFLEYIEVNHVQIFEFIRSEKQLNEKVITDIKSAAEEILNIYKTSS